MAELTTDQIELVYSDGKCARTCLFSLKNVTALDTANLSPWFKVVKRAGLVSDTGTHIAGLTISALTTVAVPAGPLNDGIWLLVVGVSS